MQPSFVYTLNVTETKVDGASITCPVYHIRIIGFKSSI